MSNQELARNKSEGGTADCRTEQKIHVVCRDCDELEELVSSKWTANAIAYDHEDEQPDHRVAFGVVA